MRLRRLDLIRYGRFTGARLDLPPGAPDLHIVVGPNEAGKSTARSAVGDLLFGIPAQSALNFLHDYGRLRIGAILQEDGAELQVRRRKGNRDTLLAADDTRLPAGEQALRPFLHGADRRFFERMFSLDHPRLREGGREILQGHGDDAAQKLFAAGAGIRGLQQRLDDLDDEAAGLWTPRRSGRRKYYIAAGKLKEAESRRREHTVSADRWRELSRELESSQQDHDRLEEEIAQAERKLSKVERIRRIARNVAKKLLLDQEIEDLGSVAEIPEGSAEKLQAAEQEYRQADLLLGETRPRLQNAKDKRDSITWDEPLLLRKAEIEKLHHQRIEVAKEGIDLPKLKRRLEDQKQELVTLAAECGWDSSDADSVARRIPHHSQLERARSVLAELDAGIVQVRSAQDSVAEAESRLTEINGDLEAIGITRDVRSLAALISAIKREHGGIGSQVAMAQTDATEARAEVERLYALLSPRPDSVELALSLSTPSEPEVQQFRDQLRDLDKEVVAQRKQSASQHKELAKAEEALRQLIADGEPTTLEHVLEARRSRDALWIALRKRFIEAGNSASSNKIEQFDSPRQVADRYQAAVARADGLGDLRSDTAELTARVEEAKRRLAAVKSELAGSNQAVTQLERRESQLTAEWNELWQSLPAEPLGPQQMLDWLRTRGKLREAVSRADRSERGLAALRGQEAQAVQALTTELERLGEDCSGLGQRRLSMVLARADTVQAELKQISESKRTLAKELRRATNQVDKRRSLLGRHLSQLKQLEAEWAALATGLALDPKTSSKETAPLLGAFAEMGNRASRIHEIQTTRIEAIEDDIRNFEAAVRKLIRAVAPTISGQDSNEAMIELEQSLNRSEQARSQALMVDKEIQTYEQRILEITSNQRAAESIIGDLQAQAGASDIEGLRAEIEKAQRSRYLAKSLGEVTEAIVQDGDGLPLPRLLAECSEADMDDLARREEKLQASKEALNESYLAARDRLRDARAAFDRVSGGDVAAIAESNRQSALAELQETAEQFVQTRTTACLLRWAIERYRSQRQGPMLHRAGELFAALTLGSFDHLKVDFDDQDQAHLVGCRRSGERVPTSGMSDGSADQLYLALRVAALEDYLDQAPQMPFVADDLFVNFDDGRAVAGLKVLAGLAQRCQVLFFTHHEHLVELARQSLAGPVQILRIEQ